MSGGTSGHTIVHLMRHGEVHNPDGVLYGRMSGFHLSDLGLKMAQKVADTVGERDITHVVASPLERAQQTAGPMALARDVEVTIDERVIESANVFQGEGFGPGARTLRKPSAWRHLWNPLRPSWGEPYVDIVERMMAAVHDARAAAHGHEAVVVSHQLPIWVTRLHAEQRSFVHHPRKRQCTLCSLTSLHFEGEELSRVTYSEPAGDLIPTRARQDPFSAGSDVPGERRS